VWAIDCWAVLLNALAYCVFFTAMDLMSERPFENLEIRKLCGMVLVLNVAGFFFAFFYKKWINIFWVEMKEKIIVEEGTGTSLGCGNIQGVNFESDGIMVRGTTADAGPYNDYPRSSQGRYVEDRVPQSARRPARQLESIDPEESLPPAGRHKRNISNADTIDPFFLSAAQEI
jgi:hypothetical protein